MAIPACPTELGDIIWYGFCGLLVLGVSETLRRLYRIEKKQDGFKIECPKCKEEMKKEMVSKEYMDKWEEGRQPLWDALKYHSHKGIEGTGEVIIK